MNKYPSLKEMGVNHPKQIARYMINGFANYDVLRIIYNRRKGSLLPVSRTYMFPRIQKKASDANGKINDVMETDPALTAALAELQDLCADREQTLCLSDSILEELRQLEEDISFRTNSIKELVTRLNETAK